MYVLVLFSSEYIKVAICGNSAFHCSNEMENGIKQINSHQ